MFIKIVFVVLLAALAHADEGRSWIGRGEEREIGRGGGGGGGGGAGGYGGYEKERRYDFYSPPKYEFNYGVEDPKTGDYKQQREERYGDKIRGEYSFIEADGTKRLVKYEADDKNGFNARVYRKGPARHPELYEVGKESIRGGGKW